VSKTGIARLFRNGRSQAVRLPREFRFEGECVRVRGVAGGVLIQPMITDPRQWFAELDRLSAGPFMTNRRESRRQPSTPKRKMFE
jgi:antitoxin VapB